MILNLYTKSNGTRKLIDTVEAPDTLIGIVPTTSDAMGYELYPRIIDITINWTCQQVEVEVKVPTGISAKFEESGGQYFIVPILS